MSERREGRRKEANVSAKQMLGGAALLLLLLWFVLNTQEVEVDLIVTTVTMPLFVALIIAGLLGALVGWLLPRIRSGS
jgi:uncharacterized integral membrane protein